MKHIPVSLDARNENVVQRSLEILSPELLHESAQPASPFCHSLEKLLAPVKVGRVVPPSLPCPLKGR